MGRPACTEPQCLYKGALYLTLYHFVPQKTLHMIMGTQKLARYFVGLVAHVCPVLRGRVIFGDFSSLSSSSALQSGWALASSSECRQRPLSCASARQFLQPSFFAYSSTSSIRLDFGRQCPRWSPEFVYNIFLGNSLSSIRTTWPAHRSLLDSITLTIFGSL